MLGTGVVVAGVLLFVAVTELLGALGGVLVSTPPAEPAPPAEAVVLRTVQPGESLWSIASELPEGGDVRRLVDRLARLNGGSLLVAGQTISIPATWLDGLEVRR